MITNTPPLPPHSAIGRAVTASICTTGHAPKRLLLADMTLPSTRRRFWVLDLSDPKHPLVEAATRVAHGAGSDPQKTGLPIRFSDTPNSGTTSLGLYRVAEPYNMAKHGKAYRLDGLSPTDAHARERGVVLHPADYVSQTGLVGRSLGCPALNPAVFTQLDRAGDLEGSLLWIDAGAATPVPSCAAASAWTVQAAQAIAQSTAIWGPKPLPACSPGDRHDA
ncbi:murein L,D-transpeptidase catalytic domain-containing protein [Rhodanobacter sp. FW102-FHT14D06]|uniref:Murein L,D-transpeptidase catalytic domain-containing protein n=2 Tax=unclassified Rhodanobacter TaxID=2621553 RepID=A0AB74UQ78_9GAMM